jgi:glycosyltransferase involved in cell wall biosynthesis
VIRNPVATATAASPASDDGPGDPVVLFVGRLVAGKDVATLIAAFHRLVEAGRAPRATLRIIGDGSERAALESAAAAGSGSARIAFRGRRTRAEVTTAMASAAMVVLPSRSEGAPRVLLEAMAVGTPVVASDIDAMRELVDDGVSGTLFPTGDAAALADKIGEVLGDRARARAMAERARRRVEREAAPPVIVARYLEVFRGASEGARDSGPANGAAAR